VQWRDQLKIGFLAFSGASQNDNDYRFQLGVTSFSLGVADKLRVKHFLI
jgi:hypothetical protein